MSPFTGFPPDAWTFLDDLGADNTKSFFDANRDRYDDAVAGPSKALVGALADVLPDHLGCDVRAEPKVGRSLFRINRDTRFAADKTPYRTHLDFLFWVGAGPPRQQPAFIMRITSSTMLVGAGRMGITGGARDAYRAALDDLARGAAVRAAVDDLLAAGADLSEPDRKSPPQPYPSDHPNADLFCRDGFHVSRTSAHPAALAAADFTGWCADALVPFVPIVDWFEGIDR